MPKVNIINKVPKEMVASGDHATIAFGNLSGVSVRAVCNFDGRADD